MPLGVLEPLLERIAGSPLPVMEVRSRRADAVFPGSGLLVRRSLRRIGPRLRPGLPRRKTTSSGRGGFFLEPRADGAGLAVGEEAAQLLMLLEGGPHVRTSR